MDLARLIAMVDDYIDGVTIIGPSSGIKDEDRWYLMQSHHTWYLVRSCCRSCATRDLQAWTNDLGVKTMIAPNWLIELGKEE